MRPLAFLLLTMLLAAVPARAAEAIPAAECQREPTAQRMDQLVAAAAAEGWGRWSTHLRDAALRAYEAEPAVGARWLQLHRWADLFATPRAKAVSAWADAISRAGAGHANMASRYELPAGSVAGVVPADLQRWLIGNAAFSAEYFATVGELDQPLNVLALLGRIRAAHPALFADYASLALAIAIVQDVPPPPDWPHGQVSAASLPRRMADPVDIFAHWTRLDRANVTAHRLKRLPALELKFVVDASAPLAELSWAQRNVTPPIEQLAKAYDMIAYRTERVERNQYQWPGRDYSLATILREGGICVDQAYFAANVGKARGVPTLLFRGAGMDGRHAWFGYLAPSGWKMDAGRYAEQRFVAGFARDPQTWLELSDHEIIFLSERFQRTPLYQLATIHTDFSREFLRAGDVERARRAAREAVSRESRHLGGWEALLATYEDRPGEARQREDVLREAKLAFQRYPDLEARFGRDWIESLRARGETSLADAEERRFVQKFQVSRSDLSVQQVAAMLTRSLQDDDIGAQVRLYQRLVDRHGRGAGVDFYDKVVVPFVRHLREAGQVPAAREALQRARRTLRVEKGSQLEQEMNRLAASLAVRS